MIAAPDSALDLPLKILIAERADGGTQVSYNKPSYLQARFDLSANLVANIAAIEQIAVAISAQNRPIRARDRFAPARLKRLPPLAIRK